MYLHVGVRHDELSHNAVVCEAIHAIADSEDENSGRGVQAVAGRQQAGPWLAHIQDAVLHSTNAASRQLLGPDKAPGYELVSVQDSVLHKVTQPSGLALADRH